MRVTHCFFGEGLAVDYGTEDAVFVDAKLASDKRESTSENGETGCVPGRMCAFLLSVPRHKCRFSSGLRPVTDFRA